jgi:hypothetical protein
VTIVIDLDRHEQPVRLRADGFESCVIAVPGFPSELRLARHYRRPWRTSVHAFVDELLTASLGPARSLTEVRALPDADRASLRRAVVAAAGCEREWRSLHGCHLTADERLFAVMYWSWRRRLRNREQMRAEHATYLATMRESVADDIHAKLGLADVMRSSSAVQAALGGAAARASVAGIVSPTAFGAIKALETHAALSRNITKLLENPLTGMLAGINGVTTMVSTVEKLRSLTESVAVSATNPVSSTLAASVALPHIDTSVTAAVTGAPFKHLMKLAAPVRLPPWTVVPSGLADMVGMGQQNAKTLAALAAVRVDASSLTALLNPSQLGTAVDAFRHIERLGEPMREMMETVALADDFDRQWQNEALYFIVSGFLTVCGLWEMRKLASLTREQVEEAVLLALEAVLSDGQFAAALRGEVAGAPFINSSQATNLDHALEHAGRREYVRACASLYWGLEGAFWEVGYATAVVTLQRTDPNKTTRAVGFESMVKRLKLGQEMKTFLVRGLYGTAGNSYRHGGADSGERRQVLLGVAALAGWFEEFTGVPALTELVTRTGRALPAAVQRVLDTPRPPGP